MGTKNWIRPLRWCVASGMLLCLIAGFCTGSSVPGHGHIQRQLPDPSNPLRASLHIRTKRNILQDLGVTRMLKDTNYVRSLINCVLERGLCDDHGRNLQRLAPEILQGRCPGCDRASKNSIRRVITHMQRNFPLEWMEVTRKYLVPPTQQIPTNVFG